jgi:MSHA biogenesis protein MshK
MADGLIRRQKVGAATPRLFARVSVFCLLSSVFCPLNAEDLPDPTRPPAMITAPDSAAGFVPRLGATENRQSSGLQTIIISESRRAAIIDGKTVEIGEKHGNARLIEVNEGSVVLQNAQSRKMLTLFPGIKINRKVTPGKLSGKQNDMPTALEEKK